MLPAGSHADRLEYEPALDGLRALAALAVVMRHAWVPGFAGGYLGVDVFFVLSGFLITRVLAGNPSLARFYLRRARRLIPPLAFMLVAYLAIFPELRPAIPHWRDAAWTFLYLTDFTKAWYQVPKYLGHTWSLSIEEHFYLLWPVMFLCSKPSVRAMVVIYAFLTLWRTFHPDWMEAYYRFDTRSSGLVLGCLIAMVPRPKIPSWPGLAVLSILLVAMARNDPAAQGLGILLAELAAAVAILGTPPLWLKNAVLVYLGKLSYGIYLWHYPIDRLLHEAKWEWWQIAPVTLVASVLLAALSYHTVEKRFRRASPRFEPSPQRSIP